MTRDAATTNSRAIEACRRTRDDARELLRRIKESGDTYFDRPDVGADVDVTDEHTTFLEAVIGRMDIALAALGDAGQDQGPAQREHGGLDDMGRS